MLKCRNCRKTIFENIEILQHVQGRGQESFHFRRREKLVQTKVQCSHLFLDFVPEDYQGKIECECGSKLGSFELGGMQCSCGHWIAPAYAILKSKIDHIN
jgi:dual specificity phosphatase 12